MASKKITYEEVGITEESTKKSISISNLFNNITQQNISNIMANSTPIQSVNVPQHLTIATDIEHNLAYGSNYNNVSNRVGTYKDYKKESIMSLIEKYPAEFDQMVKDGVEFTADELLHILNKGGYSTITVLLESEIELPRKVSEAIIKKITLYNNNSYMKKYIPKFMLPYNDIVDLNFGMGKMMDLCLYIADPLLTNVANDRLLYWIFKDDRFNDERANLCNDYVRKMYKKYKMYLKFAKEDAINFKKNYSYDIKVDVDIFNNIFAKEDEEEE